MAPSLPNDFKEFLKLLNSHRVEYLIIGGHAVGFYGYPRATGDMDVWISTHPPNLKKVIGTLEDFGFGGGVVRPELFQKPDHVIRMGVAPMRIEILTGISGVTFAECYKTKVRGKLEGMGVYFISLPYLKVNKQASGRLKDLNDLEHLPPSRRSQDLQPQARKKRK